MPDYLNDELAKLDPDAEPAEPTREERAVETADAIRNLSVRSLRAFIEAQNQGFDYVWNHPAGLTPSEVVTALGTDAVNVFQRHATTTEFLTTHAPASAALLKTRPAGWTVTPEMADGAPTGRLFITEDAA